MQFDESSEAPRPRPGPSVSPVDWRQAGDWLRAEPRRMAGVALVAVVVVGGLAFLGRGIVGRPSTAAEVSLPRAGEVALPAVTEPVVHVHAAGAVAVPGVYLLPAGARVADVVEAAGGFLPFADADRLNLAALAADGAQVYVPRRGERPAGPADARAGPLAGAPGQGPINVNTATADALESLPGIGPTLAAAIVRHRDEHGPFAGVDDLLDVAGIGPAKLEALGQDVTT